MRVVLATATALTLVACGRGSHGTNNAPTETPIPTSTPAPVVDALKASLLPASEVGPDWSRIAADPSVSRFEGDDTSLRSPCDLRGPVPVVSVAGEHLAGPNGSPDPVRPQWHETIAVFAPGPAIQEYMDRVRVECKAEGQSVERLFDRVGAAIVYVQYGAPNQIHRVLLLRHRDILIQIRYAAYTLSDADEHRFEALANAADDRALAHAGTLPGFGVSAAATPTPSGLN